MAGIAALAIAYVLSQFYRSFMAVMTPALISDLGATKAELSLASGAWFFVFALMQFAIGVALDRYGPRRTVAGLLLVGGGGGAALFAFASAPWMVIAAMALIGLGCAPVLMASFYIFAREYPPARFAMLASFLVGFGNAGNVIGAAPMAAAAEAFGWRACMGGLALVTIVVALALYALVRDPVRHDEPGADNGFAGFGELFRIRELWLIMPLSVLNYAPAAGIRGLWAGPFLADVQGLDTIAIGYVTLVMALAMVAGNFAYGPLDRLFGTRKWVAFGGNFIGMAVIIWLALNTTASTAAVTVAFALIGLFGTSYGVLMAHGRSFVPARLTGRGVTLLNFYAIGGVGIMQFLTGAVVNAGSVPAVPSSGYVALFWFYAATLAFGLTIYAFSRDAKP